MEYKTAEATLIYHAGKCVNVKTACHPYYIAAMKVYASQAVRLALEEVMNELKTVERTGVGQYEVKFPNITYLEQKIIGKLK